MIQVVDGTNRALFSAQLEQMYRRRHRGRVGAYGWHFSAPLPQPNIDEFDTEDAVLILELDNARNVTGGLRLIPTARRSVIGTYFSHAVASGKPPMDDQIYELSHYFITEAQHGLSERQRLGRLFCAAFDYGLRKSVSHFSLICNMEFLPTLLSFHWSIIPLGLPIAHEDHECVAVLIELSHIALALTREECDLSGHAMSEAFH